MPAPTKAIKEGRKDRSRGERFDFTDEGAFRSATKDYSSRLGDREIYRRYFREAFEMAIAMVTLAIKAHSNRTLSEVEYR